MLALTTFGIVASSTTIPLLTDVPLAVESRAGETVVSWVYPGSPLWDAGVRPGDALRSVDDNPVDLLHTSEQIRRAEHIEVQSAATGAVIDAETRDPQTLRDPITRTVFVVIAASFAAVGVVVYLLSRFLRQSIELLAFAVDTSVLLLAALATPFGAPWALALVFLGMLGFAFTALRLFVVFPVDQSRARAATWVLWTSAVVSLAMIVAYAWAVREPLAYPSVLRSQLLVVSLEVVLAVAAGVFAWKIARDQRSTIMLVALGLASGFAPFFTLSIAPFLISGNVLLAPELSIVGIVLIPATMGALMLRREFPGIERRVRRSLIAFVVWAVLLMVFGVGVRLLQPALAPPLHLILSPVEPVFLIALVAAVFPTTQRLASHAIERRLFHDVYEFAPAVHAITTELNRIRGVAPVSDAALQWLVNTLDLTWACLVLADTHQREPYVVGSLPAGVPSTDAEILINAELAINLVTEENTHVGLLAVGPKRHDLDLSPEDGRLVETIASVLAPVLRNALLLDELAERVDELGTREHELAALSLRVMRVQEEERRRLAADLHDEPLQYAIFLHRAMAAALDADPPASIPVRQWIESVNDLVVSLRAISTGLRPPTMDDFGVAVALETLVASIRARVDGVEIAYEASATLLDVRLPADLEMALYRAAQEGISNSLKHAAPRAIEVSLREREDGLELMVEDFGGRSAPNEWSERVPPDLISGGYGLPGIRQRLMPWHGTVHLESTTSGSVLHVVVPIELPASSV